MVRKRCQAAGDFRLVFWQRTPSPHQAPLFAALAERLGASNVVGVFQDRIGADRISLGWSDPDYGPVSLVMKPKAGEREAIILADKRRSVHIFSHLPDDAELLAVYRWCIKEGVATGLLTEGRDWRGWRGVIRRLRSAAQESTLRAELDFVLAIGSVGVQWYTKIGYPPSKIYPFCYVVKSKNLPMATDTAGDTVQIIYVGQLIRRKRLDLLISALGKVTRKNWRLTIVGAGDQRLFIEGLVRECCLQDRVAFVGVLPNDEVYRHLSDSDLLVLPSDWDGWGAVVNEALHAGVPVVCSDYCGASDLIMNPQVGKTFKAGDVDQLTYCLESRIAAGRLSFEQRQDLLRWAVCLEGGAVADYLLGVLEHALRGGRSAPSVPWKSAGKGPSAIPELISNLLRVRR